MPKLGEHPTPQESQKHSDTSKIVHAKKRLDRMAYLAELLPEKYMVIGISHGDVCNVKFAPEQIFDKVEALEILKMAKRIINDFC